MANEPTAVLLNDRSYQGQTPATLTHSNQQLDDYNLANSHNITIQGPAGSTVTFFDDCNFKTDQNYLMIIKKVDADVPLDISQDLGPDIGQNIGDRVYQGETDTYQWFLFKVVEANIFTTIFGAVAHFLDGIPVVGPIFDNAFKTINDALSTYLHIEALVWQQTTIGAFLCKWVDLGAINGTSSNFHVDNVSSIRFGVGGTGGL